MKKITFTITPTGKVTVEAHGYQGVECKEEIKNLTRNLGKVVEEQDKPELYETPTSEVRNVSY